MALDPSIALSAKPVQFENPLNMMAQVSQIQNAQQQGQLNALTMQQHQRSMDTEDAVKNLYAQQGFDLNNPESVNKLMQVSPSAGQAALKFQADQKLANATIGKSNAQAASAQSEAQKRNYELEQAKKDKAVQDVAALKSPDDALKSIDYHVQNSELPPQYADQLKQSLAGITDEQSFMKWKHTLIYNMLTPEQQMKTNQTVQNTGNQTQILQTPAYGGGAATVVPGSTAKINMSPGDAARLSQAQQFHQDTMAKDYMIAGVNQNGTPNANIENMAQMIASGKAPPPSPLAMQRPAGQTLMNRVAQINPDYDATTYTAKVAAARAFTSGNQGNALRSFAVGKDHLDQLEGLIDALDNGNIQLINNVKNRYKERTGNDAPTNLASAVDIVSKEVVKAIVGSGGGVSERGELAERMKDVKSLSQLKGAVRQYRNLMDAQQTDLLEQRRAAGLPDSTLPNYKSSNKAGSNSSGPVQIKSDSDYAELPSGTEFIAPDGSHRRKP